jgi:hypothetical protein
MMIVTNFVYMVKKEDLTHLGGPMGSEYTTTILTKIFSSKELAIKWIEKDAKKTRPDVLKEDWIISKRKSYPNSWFNDLLSIGYNIRKVKIND